MAPLVLGAVKALLAVQAVQATIAGTVRDGETGTPIAGALVALTDLERATATDADGRYILEDVPAGPRHITVRFIGYDQRTLHALVPREGRLEINVSLQPKPVHLPTIVVRPRVIIRGAEPGDSADFPDRSSSIAAVYNHPMLAEPDALQALGGGEVVMRPEAPSGVHIRGGASDQTAYLLDGIPVFSPYHAGGVFSAWNPDALSQLQLSSTAPSPAYPDALSGTISALTRSPGATILTQGSFSTTQARLTIDGPVGIAGAGFLISLRSGFPSLLAPRGEASYLRGNTGDWLAKLELPAFGGRIRLLGYDSENEIDAAAAVDSAGDPISASRNAFEWSSDSWGAEWKREISGLALRVQGWSASGAAEAAWAGQVAGVDLNSARRDEGLLASGGRSSGGTTTLAGIRIERSRTSYRIESDSSAGPRWGFDARTPVITAFAQHARPLSPQVELKVGAGLAAATGDVHLGPRVRVRWQPSEQVELSGSYGRTHQFAQSLRNAESIVGSVFPVDLFAGAGGPGVPVARSDQVVLAAEYRPAAGLRLGLQAYDRGSDGLLLVAPRDGEPFSTGAFVVGAADSRGLSLDASLSTSHLGLIASYGLQHTRLEYGDTSYVPDHGTTHLLEGGVIVFPTATTSIRLGVTGALGRRTTTIANELEWESCNLIDEGCEFGGSPHYSGGPLGTTGLPAYYRVDLGFRKHWHFALGGRDGSVALFGTLTNLLSRKNVLTYSTNPSTGKPVAVEMRPLAPLVVGLDWRF